MGIAAPRQAPPVSQEGTRNVGTVHNCKAAALKGLEAGRTGSGFERQQVFLELVEQKQRVVFGPAHDAVVDSVEDLVDILERGGRYLVETRVVPPDVDGHISEDIVQSSFDDRPSVASGHAEQKLPSGRQNAPPVQVKLTRVGRSRKGVNLDLGPANTLRSCLHLLVTKQVGRAQRQIP